MIKHEENVGHNGKSSAGNIYVSMSLLNLIYWYCRYNLFFNVILVMSLNKIQSDEHSQLHHVFSINFTDILRDMKS